MEMHGKSQWELAKAAELQVSLGRAGSQSHQQTGGDFSSEGGLHEVWAASTWVANPGAAGCEETECAEDGHGERGRRYHPD